MFDKLEDLTRRLEEINMLLTEPEVINNQEQYRELMREQSELSPVAGKYKEYKEAKEMVDLLNAGALPVGAQIIEENSIGPTLGADSIQKSKFAGLVGLSLVMIFMIL